MMRSIAAAGVAMALSLFAATAAGAQTPPDSAWVQWEADGIPHARAIVHGPACPSLTAGTRVIAMSERSAPGAGFADRVCDAIYPVDAANAHVGTLTLPQIPHAPKRIAVFGDTGCRLKGEEVQACNDPVAWPFPTIVRDIAAEHPDLVVHVCDYYYRESPCPSTVNCTNSPYGDNSASWNADFFGPMAPLFAVAPLVVTRGNHEDCKRAALGWARYLSGITQVACGAHESPEFAEFDNLLIGDVDDVTEVTETLADPPVWTADRAIVQARAVAVKKETWLVSHRPAVSYLPRQSTDPAGANVAAYLSGHLHLFGAYSFAGEAPQLIVGVGGDNLASPDEVQSLAALGGVTDKRFGYAIFERDGDGWSIVVHDIDTAVHRRCRLAARTVTCGPALTVSPAGR